MKKIILLLSAILILTGCSNVKTTKNNSSNNENSNIQKEYKNIVKKSQVKGKAQLKKISEAKKSYITEGESARLFPYPSKVNEFKDDKHKAIVVTGVVVSWGGTLRQNGHLMTKYKLHVAKQYNFKDKTNLENQDITLVGPGGYTTAGEEMDTVPYKSFAPKPSLTADQRKQVVFVEDTKLPLPRVGDQVFLTISPYDNSTDGKIDTAFREKTVFNKNQLFSLSEGVASQFTLNTRTKKYESRAVNDAGQIVARTPAGKDVDSGVEKNTETSKENQSLLNDINKNYLNE